MKEMQYIVNDHLEVLKYLKSRFPLFDASNVFFRDIQYGVQGMLEGRGVRVSYAEAERIAKALIEKLEKEKILAPIDHQTWVLRYPEFRKPVVKSASPARPSGSAPAAPGAAAPAAKPAVQQAG
jgi:hypothetical protein